MDMKQNGGAESGDASQSQSQSPPPPQNPSDVLRELAKRRDLAERMKNASEEMKQQAREMAERMTPEQRERWARQFAREMQNQQRQDDTNAAGRRSDGRTPGLNEKGQPSNYNPEKTETVDARGPEKDAGLLLDEWLSEVESMPDGGTGAAAGGGAGDPVRSAQDFARRAVNDSTVPSRYHRIIDEYFGRLDQTVRNAKATAPTGGKADENNSRSNASESPATGGDSATKP
jgi:hypothetical protein